MFRLALIAIILIFGAGGAQAGVKLIGIANSLEDEAPSSTVLPSNPHVDHGETSESAQSSEELADPPSPITWDLVVVVPEQHSALSVLLQFQPQLRHWALLKVPIS